MDLTLSVFFNIDRTYLTVVERTEKGLKLVYVNSTSKPIILEQVEEPSFAEAVIELQEILRNINFDLKRVTCTIPAESVLVTMFPGQPGITIDEIAQLVNLEIRQSYPQFEYDNFTSSVIPLAQMKHRKHMIMAVISLKQDSEIYKEILSPITNAIDNIEISQLNAHSAFLYNYPEFAEKNIMLLGVQSKFVDVSIIKNKTPLYYNLITMPQPGKFADDISVLYDKMVSEYIDNIDGIFFFGNGLQYHNIEDVRKELGRKVPNISRLNAFRMFSSSLSSRDREYCSRSSHIFPPCVGGCFPSYHERIRLV